MMEDIGLDLIVLGLLLAAVLQHYVLRLSASGPAFWGLAGAAAAASASRAVALMAGGWSTDFGSALWAIVAASTVLYLALSVMVPPSRRLGALLMPYVTVLAMIATLVRGMPQPVSATAPAVWLDIHIGLAVAILGILTLAAVAAAAVAVQERALKLKTRGPLSQRLPSVNDAEALSGQLLVLAEILLGIGLASGMAVQFMETGHLLSLTHKSLLSIAAFVLIGLLMGGHHVCGVRGRIAARVVLIAYLMIMLASPGVKFVTQVLM